MKVTPSPVKVPSLREIKLLRRLFFACQLWLSTDGDDLVDADLRASCVEKMRGACDELIAITEGASHV